MTTQLPLQETNSDFLARTLRADGLFCAATGAVCVGGAQSLATLFGLQLPVIFTILGGGLLVYGLALFMLANQTAQTRLLVQVALGLNIAWVVVSFAGLLAGLFPVSTAGKWTIAVMADLVLIIAIVQAYGLRR
jgi:hypothetical protein